MIEIKQYTSADINVWNDFLYKSRMPIFLFDRNYMEYHSDRFKDNSLMFYDDNNLIALLPLNIVNETDLFSHGGLTFGGFIYLDNIKQYKMLQCFQSLIEYMKAHSVKKLYYRPSPHMYHRYPSEEDLYSLFYIGAIVEKIEAATVVDFSYQMKIPKGRKAQIARARREGVVIEEAIEYEQFIQLENDVLQKYHGTMAVHTGQELSVLHEKFPENIKLYIARYKGKIVAGAVLYIYPNLVHTQYLASNDCGRELGALDLVVSTVMEIYRKDKQWFDFGKSTENNGKVLNEGLIFQKEGFGGRTNIYQGWIVNV